eukprot:765187-Hanusia_phi.AAC.2
MEGGPSPSTPSPRSKEGRWARRPRLPAQPSVALPFHAYAFQQLPPLAVERAESECIDGGEGHVAKLTSVDESEIQRWLGDTHVVRRTAAELAPVAGWVAAAAAREARGSIARSAGLESRPEEEGLRGTSVLRSSAVVGDGWSSWRERNDHWTQREEGGRREYGFLGSDQGASETAGAQAIGSRCSRAPPLLSPLASCLSSNRFHGAGRLFVTYQQVVVGGRLPSSVLRSIEIDHGVRPCDRCKLLRGKLRQVPIAAQDLRLETVSDTEFKCGKRMLASAFTRLNKGSLSSLSFAAPHTTLKKKSHGEEEGNSRSRWPNAVHQTSEDCLGGTFRHPVPAFESEDR